MGAMSEQSVLIARLDAAIYDILTWVDYDLAKQYSVETAEEPEFVEERMEDLRLVIVKHFPELVV